MMRRMSAVALACGLVLAVLPAQAQWKWRDKSGIVQYSDVPPPSDVAEKDILERPVAPVRRAPAASAPRPAASAPSAGVDAELEQRRKAAENQAQDEAAVKARAEQARLAAAKAENCRQAQSQLRTLESGIRLSRVNEKGEREILDDKDRAVELQRARNAVTSDCTAR